MGDFRRGRRAPSCRAGSAGDPDPKTRSEPGTRSTRDAPESRPPNRRQHHDPRIRQRNNRHPAHRRRAPGNLLAPNLLSRRPARREYRMVDRHQRRRLGSRNRPGTPRRPPSRTVRHGSPRTFHRNLLPSAKRAIRHRSRSSSPEFASPPALRPRRTTRFRNPGHPETPHRNPRIHAVAPPGSPRRFRSFHSPRVAKPRRRPLAARDSPSPVLSRNRRCHSLEPRRPLYRSNNLDSRRRFLVSVSRKPLDGHSLQPDHSRFPSRNRHRPFHRPQQFLPPPDIRPLARVSRSTVER